MVTRSDKKIVIHSAWGNKPKKGRQFAVCGKMVPKERCTKIDNEVTCGNCKKNWMYAKLRVV